MAIKRIKLSELKEVYIELLKESIDEESYSDYLDTNYSADGNDNPNEDEPSLHVTINYNQGIIEIQYVGSYEFEPYNDGSIDSEFDDMENDLLSYFNGNPINLNIDIIDYEGKARESFSSDEIIVDFSDLLETLYETNKDVEHTLSTPISEESGYEPEPIEDDNEPKEGYFGEEH